MSPLSRGCGRAPGVIESRAVAGKETAAQRRLGRATKLPRPDKVDEFTTLGATRLNLGHIRDAQDHIIINISVHKVQYLNY